MKNKNNKLNVVVFQEFYPGLRASEAVMLVSEQDATEMIHIAARGNAYIEADALADLARGECARANGLAFSRVTPKVLAEAWLRKQLEHLGGQPLSLKAAKGEAMRVAAETDALAYVVAVPSGYAVQDASAAVLTSDAIHGYADAGSPGPFGSSARYVARETLTAECGERVRGGKGEPQPEVTRESYDAYMAGVIARVEAERRADAPCEATRALAASWQAAGDDELPEGKYDFS